MKYVIFFLSIISLPSYAMDALYELPAAEEINKRLKNNGLHIFASKSNLAHKLDSKSMTPQNLYNYVQPKITDYREKSRKWPARGPGVRPCHKQPTTPIVITLLLQDHPEALIELQQNYGETLLEKNREYNV